jgi:hypothetical protein
MMTKIEMKEINEEEESYNACKGSGRYKEKMENRTSHNWTPNHLSGKCINICEARGKQMILETKNVNLAIDSVSEHYKCCQNESHRHACSHSYTAE